MERRIFKPCLPSVVMGNVQSVNNKMDVKMESHGVPGVQSDVFH